MPAACTTKDSTSPQTKIFVSLVLRINACVSPSVKCIMRPSSMYILAAKRAGATSKNIVWIVYAPSVQSGVW